MQITVKTLTGKEIFVGIEETDLVARIKDQIEIQSGVPPPQQRLIFAGKQLRDDATAKDSNILPKSTLHLVLALRGGFRD